MSLSSIEKLNRATKHIEELEDVCALFVGSNPYEITSTDNPDTGERSYHLIGFRDFPDDIPLICGDALHNLRSALDHLAWRLVKKAGGTPTKNTCFPIAESAQKYQTTEMKRRVEGMSQEAMNVIDGFKPYKGGNDPLWRLHRLHARDKHSLLITVGTAHLARSMTPTEREKIARIYTGSHPNEPLPDLSRLLKPAEPVRILKVGDVIHTVPKSEVEDNMQFQVDVAFNEPGIIEGEPVVAALHEMKKAVTAIVLRFWGQF
jgi:hypothetical protein